MSDGRSKRKSKVVPFIGHLEKERQLNLEALVDKAKMLKPEGFENVDWNLNSWKITSGRLVKLTGRNTLSTALNFSYSPKRGGDDLVDEWSLVAKALVILRFHRKNQSAPNQRNFITSLSYIAYCANQVGSDLVKMTPEILDNACRLISEDYGDSTAYNLHKSVAEFAGHCDANRLCRILFKYKYSKMNRPTNTGGVSYKRLDDKTVLDSTMGEKIIDKEVYRVLGELYKNVPKDHKYRFYILVLTLLLCTGRRFSEISALPFQAELNKDNDGKEFLYYFPRKTTQGDAFTPKRKLYMPTQVLEIVRNVLKEINQLCGPARDTAAEMFRANDVDLRFLSEVPNKKRLYKDELIELGISPTVIDTTGWIRKNNLSKPDPEKVTTKQGIIPSHPLQYTKKAGVIAYCRQQLKDTSHDPVHIDQKGDKVYLKDLLLVRHLGLSSGYYAQWLATECTHSMMTTFLRYLPELAKEFTKKKLKVDFTSHHFRHSLNTLLDEGGLSDVMQTEWFGRANPNDTKAYQHMSREKRVLMLREDIKKGRIGGQLVEQINSVPVTVQDAILSARINAAQDVGTGMCIHHYSQTPCGRHLECSADCKDYLWIKDDEGRVDEMKRQYAFTSVARDEAEKRSKTAKPKKSVDWLLHNDKKLETLNQQLEANGVEYFNPVDFLAELNNG